VRDRRIVLGGTLASVVIACYWFAEAYPTFIYDSWGYHYLAEIIRTRGLLAWPTDIRTYGYPLFLAAVSGFRAMPQEELRLLVFGVQLAAYLTACAYVGRKLAAVFDSPRLGALAYVAGALNPILLLHTAEPLSDLLSAVLILASVALAWKAPARERPGAPRIQIFLSFFFAAAGVAIRPANIVVVAASSWCGRSARCIGATSASPARVRRSPGSSRRSFPRSSSTTASSGPSTRSSRRTSTGSRRTGAWER